MSPGPRRDKLEALMGAVIAGGTPWFVWAYLHVTFPEIPMVEGIGPDLWTYLLNRVLLFSFLIDLVFLIIGMRLGRKKFVQALVAVSGLYLVIALYYRWEWL